MRIHEDGNASPRLTIRTARAPGTENLSPVGIAPAKQTGWLSMSCYSGMANRWTSWPGRERTAATGGTGCSVGGSKRLARTCVNQRRVWATAVCATSGGSCCRPEPEKCGLVLPKRSDRTVTLGSCGWNARQVALGRDRTESCSRRRSFAQPGQRRGGAVAASPSYSPCRRGPSRLAQWRRQPALA